jgi:hypothetical protein
MESWFPQYQRAIELPAAKVYVALREGTLSAKGISLPHIEPDRALHALTKESQDLADATSVEIPREFWSQREIFWEQSAALYLRLGTRPPTYPRRVRDGKVARLRRASVRRLGRARAMRDLISSSLMPIPVSRTRKTTCSPSRPVEMITCPPRASKLDRIGKQVDTR